MVSFRVLAALGIVFLMAAGTPPAHASSVYDSNVENRLGLSAGQRSKVVRIVRASRSQRNKILRKHKIDPNGKPDLRRLSFAGSELRELGRRERSQLAKILNSKQMQQYDAIVQQTRERIIEAANEKD